MKLPPCFVRLCPDLNFYANVCMYVRMYAYIQIIYTYVHTYIQIIHAYIHKYMHKIDEYTHAYMYAYIYIYIVHVYKTHHFMLLQRKKYKGMLVQSAFTEPSIYAHDLTKKNQM